MADEKDVREVLQQEKRSEPSGKYKPLLRNKQTERDIARIFEHGTEQELTTFLRESGLKDESPRFALIVRLFRERGGKH